MGSNPLLPPTAQPTTVAGPDDSSPMLQLPAELLSNVAFHVALQATTGPPSTLLPLLLTHSRMRCLSSENNPSLYARILQATWDLDAVQRRYGSDALRDHRVRSAELRKRWGLMRIMRDIGKDVGGWLKAHGSEGEGIVERTKMELLLLVMENDGRNLSHIIGWGGLPNLLFQLYQYVMLPISLQPGFPVDSVTHGVHCQLTMWLMEAGEHLRKVTLLDGRPAPPSETDEQTQEKVFVLRPLVFNPPYSPFIAPWQIKSLPLSPPAAERVFCPDERARAKSSDGVENGELEGQDGKKAYELERFGRTWAMDAPKLGRAAIFGLLNALDVDPSIGGVVSAASNSSTTSLDFLYSVAEAKVAVPGRTRSYDPVSDTQLRQSIPVMHLGSRAFDNDWLRMTRCKSLTDRGMSVKDWKGKFEGRWVGSFGYFDFNGFSQILAGDAEAVYTNAFGQLANEVELFERIVYVRRSQLGGTGSILAAGYPADGSEDECRPCSFEEEHLDDEEGSEWVKELLVQGRGRSRWGRFSYRGRVRAWDGLLTMEKRYERTEDEPITQAVTAKWLYRGYVQFDSRMIGKWRDTYTTENSLSYEGPFCLRKQDEPYLLPLRQPSSRGSTASHSTSSTALNLHEPGTAATSPEFAVAGLMDLPGFQAATTRMQETPQPLVVKGPMDVASFEAAITRVRESDRSAESVREEVKSDLDGGERGLSLDFMVPRQQEPSVKRARSERRSEEADGKRPRLTEATVLDDTPSTSTFSDSTPSTDLLNTLQAPSSRKITISDLLSGSPQPGPPREL